MKDLYFTIDTVYVAIHKEKGSKFIAFAHPITTADQAKDIIDSYRKDSRFKGACHFCYAYKLGANNIYRSSDDGEPSGTAGKPIFNQIESFSLNDLLVVVVRFFGGTLLGTSGLIQAYKKATYDCLLKVVPVEFVVRKKLSITFSYSLQAEIDRLLNGYNIIFEEKKFELNVTYILKIRVGELNNIIEKINKSVFSKQINVNEY